MTRKEDCRHRKLALLLQGQRIVDVSDDFCRLTGYSRSRCLVPGFVYDLCPGSEWRYLQLTGWTTLTIRLADGRTMLLEVHVEPSDGGTRVEMPADE